MVLKLYNTLTRKKERFKPIKDKKVGFYTCGPTVYDYAHIGNFRAFVFNDILRRYLKYKGYKVKQVMNITDVDDKTINGSRKKGINLKEYTAKYTKAFFYDLKKLNIEKVEYYPRATDHIKEIVDTISRLINKGYAYKSDDGIYFDISKFKDYGKLAGLKKIKLKKGAKVKQDEYDKDKVQDFALWKSYSKEDGNVFWKTKLGRGRPGWHIECSVMSVKYLGIPMDIHCGGIDLIFPHHENEIAQSEAAFNKKFVNYWLHNEFILVNGKKMSKSLGNFYTLRDLDKKYDPLAIRYLLLSVHYRQRLNFTENGIVAAENTLERLRNFILKLDESNGKNNKKVNSLIKKAEKEFEEQMDDDLNVSKALSVIFNLMKEINKLDVSKEEAKRIKLLLLKFDEVLGLDLKKIKIKTKISPEKLRKDKKYKEADKIRTQLIKKGIFLDDTPNGVKVRVK